MKHLERLSWLYLLAPWVPFAVGWLRPSLAAAVLVLLAASVWSLRRAPGEVAQPEAGSSVVAVVAVLALALLWTGWSGVGGYGHQNPDWSKHNSILKDLIDQRWPPVYFGIPTDPAGVSPLLYYFAYYLPAAIVGKLAGWQAANEALFVWTVAGVALALLWFGALSGRIRLLAALLFVLWGGLDVIGGALMGRTPVSGTKHLEWWAVDPVPHAIHFFQYSANTSHLYWAPQHALSGWLATALLLHRITVRRTMAGVPLVIAGTVIWSPFVTLGLLPFAAAGLWINRARGALSPSNWLAPPLMLGIAAAFFAASQNPAPSGWLLAQFHVGDWPKLWLLYALEFGLYALFCQRTWASDRITRLLFGTAIATLLLLPFYRIGEYNDFTMRAALPSQFFLALCLAREIFVRPWTTDTRILAALLFVATFSPLVEIARSVEAYPSERPAAATVPPVRELPPLDFARQYMGYGGSFYSRFVGAALPSPLVLEPAGEADDEPRAYVFTLAEPIADALLVVRHPPAAHSGFVAALDGSGPARPRPVPVPERSVSIIDEIPLGRIDSGEHRLTLRSELKRLPPPELVLLVESRIQPLSP